MKTIIMTLALMLSIAAYGETSKDTTTVSECETLTRSKSFNLPFFNISIRSSHKQGKDTEFIVTTDEKKFDAHLSGFHVGFTHDINSHQSNFDNNMARSVELGFVFAETTNELAINKNVGFSLGLGVNWRNHKLSDRQWLIKDGDNTLTMPVAEGYTIDYSTIRIFSINMPFVFAVQKPELHGLHAYVGPQADFRLGRRIKTKYTDPNGKQDTRTKKHLRTIPVGCDVVASVGFEDIALYAKFSPTPLFKKEYGPVNQAVTVGFKWVW